MWYWTKILFSIFCGAVAVWLIYEIVTFPNISKLRTENPVSSSMIEYRLAEMQAEGRQPQKYQIWMPIEQISPHLHRAVLAGEDARFFEHNGFDWDAINKAWEEAQREGEKEAKERRRLRPEQLDSADALLSNAALRPSRSSSQKISIFRKTAISCEKDASFNHIFYRKELSKKRIMELYLNIIEWATAYTARKPHRAIISKNPLQILLRRKPLIYRR
jgi:monofunctional biosynthetic peptidoglycan transglycosylase